jgi:hypothetical protein
VRVRAAEERKGDETARRRDGRRIDFCFLAATKRGLAAEEVEESPDALLRAVTEVMEARGSAEGRNRRGERGGRVKGSWEVEEGP